MVYVAWTDWRVMARPWAIITFWVLLLAVTGEWMELVHGDGAKRVLILLVTAGVLGYALWRTPRDPLVYFGVLAVVVGISLNYLWLPLRSAQYPAINEGEPVGFFSQALADVLNRVQYGKPSLLERQASFCGSARQLLAVLHLAVRARLGSDRRRGRHRPLQRARSLGRVDPVEARPPRGSGRGGAAQRADGGTRLLHELQVRLLPVSDPESLPREVRERDYFFIGSFSAFGAFVALGLGATMQAIVDGFSRKGHAGPALGGREPGPGARADPPRREPGEREPGATRPWPAISLTTCCSRWSPTAS